MKSYLPVFLILLFTACNTIPEEATFLNEDIYLVYPHSSVNSVQVDPRTTINAYYSDSVQYAAILTTMDEIIVPDSINSVDGFDANLYQFATVRGGIDLEVEDIELSGHPASRFSFSSPQYGENQQWKSEGIFLYHDKSMIIVEYVCRADIHEAMEGDREKLLSSLGVKK